MMPPEARGAPELGSEIAGYRLESVLGEGGMGTVYLAHGPEGGLCAVKVLSRRLAGADPSFATRFKREVQYADALDHPHVLELYEAGETPDGTLFFAMQYVDGPDLGVLLSRDGPLSLDQALAILGPIGDALDSAHANGLVHRDVKPGNVIVAEDAGGPHAYLTDFGLSKNPETDSIALTQHGPAHRHPGLHGARGDPRNRIAWIISQTSTRSAASCTKRLWARRRSFASATSTCSTHTWATPAPRRRRPARTCRAGSTM